MTEMGEVSRESVIDTLRRNGVTVTPDKDGSYIIQRGDVIQFQIFPAYVGRKALHYLQRHFGVSIHLFFSGTPTAAATPLAVVKPITKTAS